MSSPIEIALGRIENQKIIINNDMNKLQYDLSYRTGKRDGLIDAMDIIKAEMQKIEIK